jgi:hypothetical protein
MYTSRWKSAPFKPGLQENAICAALKRRSSTELHAFFWKLATHYWVNRGLKDLKKIRKERQFKEVESRFGEERNLWEVRIVIRLTQSRSSCNWLLEHSTNSGLRVGSAITPCASGDPRCPHSNTAYIALEERILQACVPSRMRFTRR